MSDLRPKGTKIKLGKEEYGLRFTLNAIDDIQDNFDISISQLTDLFKDEKKQIKSLRYLLTLLINEDIDCTNDETGESKTHLEERYVGRHIDSKNMQEIMSTILQAFSSSTPETDEDEIPNEASE